MLFNVRDLLCAFGISYSYYCLWLWENKTGSGIRGSSTLLEPHEIYLHAALSKSVQGHITVRVLGGN